MRQICRYSLCILIVLGIACSVASSQEEWMPDVNLRQAVRTKLNLPQNTLLTVLHLERLYDLVVLESDIANLQGLEHAVNLHFLHLSHSRIIDLTPLADLVSLEVLKLYHNEVEDISPLANLTNLAELNLSDNQIMDVAPLTNLVNLNVLFLGNNPITDYSPISELSGVDFGYCEIPRFSTIDRVKNRNYPSIFSAWHNIINLPTLSYSERLAHHDLHFCCPMFGLSFAETEQGVKLVGNLSAARNQRDTILEQNPNMLFLVGIYYYGAHPDMYPEDWQYWLRDEDGNRVQDVGWSELLIDFTIREAQDFFVQQVIAVAECGLYDGIFLDWWSEEWNALYNRRTGKRYYTLEVEVEARVSMLRRIREVVGDDFLILVNTNRSKIPRSAAYVNGTFMETLRDHEDGYTYAGLSEIESTLLWSEENFQYPQINSLEGWGIETEPLDSYTNRRWMRLFTTLSLTHSDGYVQYVSGIGSTIHTHVYEIWERHSNEHARGEIHDHQHQHYYYDFWAANLGQPIGEKAQLYENREGLFIREFTNGWAVYNRSGETQEISLPEQATGVESRLRNTLHIVPNLDGEIYLKSTTNKYDVNGDGIVNILDLVVVASGLGTGEPDVNGDGVVNILDLVAVANAFGQ